MSVIFSYLSLVIGHWSLVIGHWSFVRLPSLVTFFKESRILSTPIYGVWALKKHAYMERSKEKRKMVIPFPGASPTPPIPHLLVPASPRHRVS
ncbi:MAG: hypothetical protein F6K31_29485 [Symploca sp. SIO2G7]|nr:hypothetical protein [Symploca sp. SIO2G7]